MRTLEDIEVPRLQSCSFYPYTLNENGEVALLMRNKKDSKNSEYYLDFGTTVKESDPNILYSAARSYLAKSGGLCLASELEVVNSHSEVEKRLKDHSQKNDIDIFTHPKIKEILGTIVSNKFHMVKDVIGESHISFFYPLPYFRLEAINKAFADSEKYFDTSLHWITLGEITEVEFHSKYLSAFDF